MLYHVQQQRGEPVIEVRTGGGVTSVALPSYLDCSSKSFGMST